MTMKHETTRFGEIEYPEEVIMTFSEGVLGFPDDKRFILLEHGAEGSPFKWLQSLDSAELAFIVLDPTHLVLDYKIELDQDTARMIETEEVENCALMAIVNVPHDNPILMTANLKAPLVVNVDSRSGRQMVLGTQLYPINMAVFPTINQNMDRIDKETNPKNTRSQASISGGIASI